MNLVKEMRDEKQNKTAKKKKKTGKDGQLKKDIRTDWQKREGERREREKTKDTDEKTA